jgi:hypothetical protein
LDISSSIDSKLDFETIWRWTSINCELLGLFLVIEPSGYELATPDEAFAYRTHPAPRSTFPGSLPVIFPSSITGTPFTST